MEESRRGFQLASLKLQMGKMRTKILAPIHGKLTADGKVSEPDIAWLLDAWFARHSEVNRDIARPRVVRGSWTTEDGLPTEVLHASIESESLDQPYDPLDDSDLYSYWIAEPRYSEGSEEATGPARITDHNGARPFSPQVCRAANWFTHAVLSGEFGPDDSRDGRSAVFLKDTSIVSRAVEIFLSHLRVDAAGQVLNHEEAERAATEHLRELCY